MKSLISIVMLVFLAACMQGQVYLHLEKKNSLKSIRFSTGQSLTFTLKSTPGVWRTEVIRKIDSENNLLVLEEGFRSIEEVDRIRRHRKWSKQVGDGLMQFSAGWFLFGGIATIADSGYTMSTDEVIIGGSFAAAGYSIRKLFYRRDIKLGGRYRLRIVDLRMSVPDLLHERSDSKN